MPQGLMVLGDHGVVQIDENYSNLALKASGSIYVPAGATGASVVVYGVQAPVMCVKTPEGLPVYVTSDQAVPNATYTFKAEDSATTIQWYVFDQTAPASATSGLTVYRSDGSPAYNSDWKVMKIAAVAAVPYWSDPYVTAPTATASAPYVGSWAACLTSARIGIDGGGGGSVSGIWADGVITNPYGAYTSQIRVDVIQWGGQPPEVIQPNGGVILLVDVSNS
ncbi:hypothetical protein LP414_27900 [Polaromonas sp. P1(28)-13]|nr:hypothetical protein LP414_27900 [Polaromonas sp. P1(28)-13]